MESCAGAIGFFFVALAAGLSHFPEVESAPAASPIKNANISSAKTEIIKTEVRKRFTKLF
jgi:hypothetical protein